MKKLLMVFFLMVLPLQAMDTAKHVLALLSSRSRRPAASTRVAPVVQMLPKNEEVKSSTATIDAPRNDSPKTEVSTNSFIISIRDSSSLPIEQINLSTLWKKQYEESRSIAIVEEDRPGFELLKRHLGLAAVMAGMSDAEGRLTLKQSLAKELISITEEDASSVVKLRLLEQQSMKRDAADLKLGAIAQFASKYDISLVAEIAYSKLKERFCDASIFDTLLKVEDPARFEPFCINDQLCSRLGRNILSDVSGKLGSRYAKKMCLNKIFSCPDIDYAIHPDGKTFAIIHMENDTQILKVHRVNDKLGIVVDITKFLLEDAPGKFKTRQVTFIGSDVIVEGSYSRSYPGVITSEREDKKYTVSYPASNHVIEQTQPGWLKHFLDTALVSLPWRRKRSGDLIYASGNNEISVYTIPYTQLCNLNEHITPAQALLLRQILTYDQTLTQALQLFPSLVKVAESLDEGNLKDTGVLQLIKDL